MAPPSGGAVSAFREEAVSSAPLRIALFIALAASLAGPARAQTETFDKPITIYVAGTAGGGIDLVSRALARHFGEHLAGKPSVVVQDMPGAGGIRAANFIAESAPRDGTAMGTFAGGPIIEPLIGARNPGYDMSKFTWIGAATKDVGLCVAMASSPFKTIDDARRQEMIVAGTGAGSETDTYPIILNEVLKTKMKLVTGYLGTKETIMAMETGEAHGRCSFALSALKMTRPDWIPQKKVNILFQLALEKSPELPDVPLALDFVTNEADRQLLELMMATKAIGLPFTAPPGVPAARASALRRAFDATMKDPAFLAEAAKMRLVIAPTTGERAQAIVAKMYATPASVVERAKKLLAPR
jgi:tripartite-type tricarboxylate transporter receptor subunit TctC